MSVDVDRLAELVEAATPSRDGPVTLYPTEATWDLGAAAAAALPAFIAELRALRAVREAAEGALRLAYGVPGGAFAGALRHDHLHDNDIPDHQVGIELRRDRMAARDLIRALDAMREKEEQR